MSGKEIKIDRGVSDVNNLLKHLANEEKRVRKETWLREYYSKTNRRKDTHDQKYADSGK